MTQNNDRELVDGDVCGGASLFAHELGMTAFYSQAMRMLPPSAISVELNDSFV